MLDDCSPVPAHARPLQGQRVLILEPSSIIALDLEAMVADAGAQVVASVARADEALALLQTERIEAALLAVAPTEGHSGYVVADALAARSIPFAFVSGFHPEQLAERYRQAPCLLKPCTPEQLRSTLLVLFGSAA